MATEVNEAVIRAHTPGHAHTPSCHARPHTNSRARGRFRKELMDLRASKSDGWEHEHTTNTVTRRSVEREGRRRTRALLLVLRCTVHSRVGVVAMRGNEATCATLVRSSSLLLYSDLLGFVGIRSLNLALSAPSAPSYPARPGPARP